MAHKEHTLLFIWWIMKLRWEQHIVFYLFIYLVNCQHCYQGSARKLIWVQTHPVWLRTGNTFTSCSPGESWIIICIPPADTTRDNLNSSWWQIREGIIINPYLPGYRRCHEIQLFNWFLLWNRNLVREQLICLYRHHG